MDLCNSLIRWQRLSALRLWTGHNCGCKQQLTVPIIKYVYYFPWKSAWKSKQTTLSLALVISKCQSMTLRCSKRSSFWTFRVPALGKGGLIDANVNIHLILPVISRLREDVSSSCYLKSLNTMLWSFEHSGLSSAEKNYGHETFSLKQMFVHGKPFQFFHVMVVSSCCLSKLREEVLIVFTWIFLRKIFLHTHLFMPNTINNFQDFRKLLKSTRSAKKLSLGMFYCFLRSGWYCTYCKWLFGTRFLFSAWNTILSPPTSTEIHVPALNSPAVLKDMDSLSQHMCSASFLQSSRCSVPWDARICSDSLTMGKNRAVYKNIISYHYDFIYPFLHDSPLFFCPFLAVYFYCIR